MGSKIFIPLDRLSSVLETLSRRIELWIPATPKSGMHATEFLRFHPGMVPTMNRQSTLPPKKLLLPQVETLLQFEYRKDPQDPSRHTVDLSAEAEAHPVLVFGSRPCDVRGFLTFDRVFTGGPYKDPYYRKRRENTFFATLVCRESDGACFCSSVGSGPADMEGSDLGVTPIEGGYLVEVLNERAQFLIDSLGDAPTEEQTALANDVVREVSRHRVGEVDLDDSPQAFVRRFEAKDYWREMAGQCLSCGICTYVCPTCYCFTITDEQKDLRGERMRSWDACMFFQYTSEASGHNPRPTKLERYRNRVGHKFSTIPEKYDGLVGCCGCGRCIRSCPVSIDIRKVVEQLKEEVCVCA
jgi:sulfhydrogenase subunit beta (sulfur reductase)